MLNSVYSGNELTNGIHFRSKSRAPHVFQRSELNIPPFRSRVSGVWEPPFRWGRASAPDGESRYLFRYFRYCCALSPHELSMAAGGVVRGRHAVYLVALMNI